MWDVVYLAHSLPHLFNSCFYIICSFTIKAVFFELSTIAVSISIDTVWLNLGGLWYEMGIRNANEQALQLQDCAFIWLCCTAKWTGNWPNSCSNLKLALSFNWILQLTKQGQIRSIFDLFLFFNNYRTVQLNYYWYFGQWIKFV